MTLQLTYRPRSFKTVIGNEETIDALSSVLSREDKPHVYLFVGPSGCGKTTLARIVSKELGCSKHDFQELNAADFNGIETVRTIRRQMQYKPAVGKVRVWLLDEVHMLSAQAQEAILKELEDTPNHVYFIFGTTNPEKLKPTFKRRCSIFSLEPVTDSAMMKLFKRIMKKENKEVAVSVLKQIMQDSGGSPGIALSILDKVIDMDKSGQLKAAKQQAEKSNESIELCRMLMKKAKWGAVSAFLKEMKTEPEGMRRLMLSYCTSTLLNSGQGRAADIIELFQDNFYDSGKAGFVLACYDAVTK